MGSYEDILVGSYEDIFVGSYEDIFVTHEDIFVTHEDIFVGSYEDILYLLRTCSYRSTRSSLVREFEGLNDMQDSVPVTMVDLREETLDTVHSVKSHTSLLLLGVGIN